MQDLRFRRALLNGSRANMLRNAADIELTGAVFKGLPPNLNYNCPAFTMTEEFRQSLIEEAKAIRAKYDDPSWVEEQIKHWTEAERRNAQAA